MQNNNKNKPGKRHFSNHKNENNRRPRTNKPQVKHRKFTYERFKNRIKLRRIDPQGNTDAFLKDLYSYLGYDPIADHIGIDGDSPTHEVMINFRKHLFNGYHLYKILVSVENHFTSGYTYRDYGWVVGHSERGKDAMNMTIILDKTLVGDTDCDLHNIIFFKALALASELFTKSGKIIRVMIKKDIYDKQKKYMSKAWNVDDDQTFTSLLGSVINLKDNELNYVVLKNSSYGLPIKVGTKIDLPLLEYLQIRSEKLLAINSRAFAGIDLYTKNPSVIGGHRLFASISKCDKSKEIHFRCSDNDVSDVENIIKDGIFYENSFYKHVYDDVSEIKLIHDGDLLSKKDDNSNSKND